MSWWVLGERFSKVIMVDSPAAFARKKRTWIWCNSPFLLERIGLAAITVHPFALGNCGFVFLSGPFALKRMHSMA